MKSWLSSGACLALGFVAGCGISSASAQSATDDLVYCMPFEARVFDTQLVLLRSLSAAEVAELDLIDVTRDEFEAAQQSNAIQQIYSTSNHQFSIYFSELRNDVFGVSSFFVAQNQFMVQSLVCEDIAASVQPEPEEQPQAPQTFTARDLMERHAERILAGNIDERALASFLPADVAPLVPMVLESARRDGVTVEAISGCLRRTNTASSSQDDFAQAMFDAGYGEGSLGESEVQSLRAEYDYDGLMLLGLVNAMNCIVP